MRFVKIAELKDRLSEHLRSVEAGAELIVTDRHRPIARLVAVTGQRRLLTIVPPKISLAALRKRKRRPAGWPASSGALLAEERRER